MLEYWNNGSDIHHSIIRIFHRSTIPSFQFVLRESLRFERPLHLIANLFGKVFE